MSDIFLIFGILFCIIGAAVKHCDLINTEKENQILSDRNRDLGLVNRHLMSEELRKNQDVFSIVFKNGTVIRRETK